MAFLSTHLYRIPITIDESQIDADLTDFTVKVSLTSSILDFSKALSTGFDIRFTESDGTTLLKYERDQHDDSIDEAVYYVKIPVVDDTIDTLFYIYYGDADASDGEDSVNTWDSNYKRVYHCKDLTTSTIKDSTGNQDGTKGSASNPAEITSDIYKGQNFVESNSDNIAIGTLGINGSITMEAYIKPDAFTTVDSLIGTSDTPGLLPTRYGMCLTFSSGSVRILTGNNSGGTQDKTYALSGSTGVYQYVAGRADGSNLKAWLDTSTDSVAQTTTPNLAHPSRLGRFGDFNGHYFDGIIDEIRISDVARSDAWIKATQADLSDNLLSFGTEEVNDTIEEAENILILDSVEIQDQTRELDENILITDEVEIQDQSREFDENLLITDSVILSTINLNQDAYFGSKILSINPLIFVTNTSPAEIVKVDTTDPENLTWEIEQIIGVDYLLDAQINTETEMIYAVGDSGLIVKIDVNDISIQTIIDTLDVDSLTKIDINIENGLVYAASENNVGELYMLDERDSSFGDMQASFLIEKSLFGDIQVDFIEFSFIDSDITFLSQSTSVINTNIHFVFEDEPIGELDFEVFLDGVLLNQYDVAHNSIDITESLDQEIVATFRLNRKHDNINFDLEGVSKPITSNNLIRIDVKGVEIFEGLISSIDCNYNINEEFITVTATMDEKVHNNTLINLSLPSLELPLGLYEVFVQNPRIFDPEINTALANSTAFRGVKVALGNKIVQNYSRYTFFDSTGSLAEAITNGTFVAEQNWTYFWSPTARLIKHPSIFTLNNSFLTIPEEDGNFSQIKTPVFKHGNTPFTNIGIGDTTAIHFLYIGTSLSPVSESLWVLSNAKHRKQRRYEDQISRVGTTGIISLGEIEALNLPLDSQSLFTALTIAGYVNGSGVIQNSFIDFIFDPEEMNIGYSKSIRNALYTLLDQSVGYYVGEAPFQSISVNNGIFVPKFHWEDREDGLYSFKEAAYNFEEYAKKVADLEYEKLSTINGYVFPQTSCSITVSIDAYLYYGFNLLNRINIDNTTTVNEFKNNNGFPVSIKSIKISSATRQVTLETDNLKSAQELKAIDGLYPSEEDDEYNTPESSIFIAQKSNMKTGRKIE